MWVERKGEGVYEFIESSEVADVNFEDIFKVSKEKRFVLSLE